MIIQRYLFREVLRAFAAVIAVLVLVYVSDRFVRYLGDAAAGKLSSDLLFRLLLLKLASNLDLLLPAAIYLAVLLGLGRLYKDSEVVAMAAGGIGGWRLLTGVFWLGIVFATGVAVLSLYVRPRVEALQTATYTRARDESDITGIFPGRFKQFGSGDDIAYVQSIDGDARTMRNVFVQLRDPQRDAVLVSRQAFLIRHDRNNDRFMVMENGHRYQGKPGSVDYSITAFHRYGVRVEQNDNAAQGVNTDEMTLTQLLSSSNPRYAAELQWRLAHPISTLLLMLLAVPLARTSSRQGKYAKLFIAVLIYFIYNNMLGVAQNLVERGSLSPLVGLWPVHVGLALVIAALLLQQSPTRRRLLLAWTRKRPRR